MGEVATAGAAFDFTKAKPSQAFGRLNPADDNLSDGIGSSYGVIGYRGKVWSLRYKGETHTFTRPDDGSPAGSIDVIVLRQAPNKSKSFYEGGYDPKNSDGKRPMCSSLDGVVPDADVPQQQAESCAICPRNAWKTNAEGRKFRDCSDFKRLAVMILPTLSKTLLGAPLMEPVFLRIPPASLNALAKLGEDMGNQGWHYSTYLVRISFDADAAHPKMVFKALQPLNDAEAQFVMGVREEPISSRITGEDQLGKPRIAAAPRPVALPAQPQAAERASPPMIEGKVIELKQPVAAPAPAPAPAPAGNMFADAIAPGAGNAAAVLNRPPQQSASDTAVESTPDLDQRIKNLLK